MKEILEHYFGTPLVSTMLLSFAALAGIYLLYRFLVDKEKARREMFTRKESRRLHNRQK